MKLVKGWTGKSLRALLWGFMVLRLQRVMSLFTRETKSEVTVAFTVGLIYYTRGVTIYGVKESQEHTVIVSVSISKPWK